MKSNNEAAGLIRACQAEGARMAAGLCREPGQETWVGISGTIMVGGIELVESTLQAGEDRYLLRNVASMGRPR